jgi:DMSO/TMAO reductase YedYZ molybdopterin-dependent catalytic subunit
VRLVLAALLLVGLLAAQSPPALAQAVVVTRSAEQPHDITRADVEKLPATEERIAFLTSHGNEEAAYTGALLWTVLDHAAALGGNPRDHAHLIVTVTGHDGYVAALALAEIDPEFAGKQVLLAYRRDGQPLPDNELRLVVPGDKRGGRSVRDVVRIDVR